MRAFALFLFLAIAVPCHAEDPLETLNTVEDTLDTMERTLKLRAGPAGGAAAAAGGGVSERLPLDDRLYFVADEAAGPSHWLAVRPCTEELAAGRSSSDALSCVLQPDGSVALGPYFWKSRPASARDLQVGTAVILRDPSGDGAWVLATVTDVSHIDSGFVATSAPFPAPLGGLRVVE